MKRVLNMVDALFLGIAVLTIVSAIAALEMRSLVYSGIIGPGGIL